MGQGRSGRARAHHDRCRPDARPLSKYIYGQFIEHLGRCIYGGIWAEMLEDRKFYGDVGRGGSPWKVVGDAHSVTMDKQAAFVGALAADHSPGRIGPAALALRKGKHYVGRIWLAGEPAAAPLKISLIWGDGPDARQTVSVDTLGPEYAKTPLEFTAAADTEQGRLEIVATGKGPLHLGTVSLMPADNVQGMRADTLALLKELKCARLSLARRQFRERLQLARRHRRARPPAAAEEPGLAGHRTQRFRHGRVSRFLPHRGAEPYIAVNAGLGNVDMAADEVQYANGAATTAQGALRGKGGHAEPYKVRWWSIGNEMYGNWQLGHMPLEKYVQKHNQFAAAMRAVDPSIQLIAVGDVGPWSESMLQHCAPQMNLMSEHFYCGADKDLAAHVRQIPARIRSKAEAHRRYRREIKSLEGRDIRIAMDEWNYWYGPDLYGEIGTRYFLRDALGIAAGLNEYSRQSDIVFMANYAQTVNVIGCIKTSKTAAAFETTGLVLKLYRREFGTLPVAATAARAAGRGRRLDRRPQDFDHRDSQSHPAKAGTALEDKRRRVAWAGPPLADRGQRPDGLQRAGQGGESGHRVVARDGDAGAAVAGPVQRDALCPRPRIAVRLPLRVRRRRRGLAARVDHVQFGRGENRTLHGGQQDVAADLRGRHGDMRRGRKGVERVCVLLGPRTLRVRRRVAHRVVQTVVAQRSDPMHVFRQTGHPSRNVVEHPIPLDGVGRHMVHDERETPRAGRRPAPRQGQRGAAAVARKILGQHPTLDDLGTAEDEPAGRVCRGPRHARGRRGRPRVFAALRDFGRRSIHHDELARGHVLDRRRVNFRFAGLDPACDGHAIVESNRGRQLAARAGWKAHFGAVIESQTVRFAVGTGVEIRHHAAFAGYRSGRAVAGRCPGRTRRLGCREVGGRGQRGQQGQHHSPALHGVSPMESLGPRVKIT